MVAGSREISRAPAPRQQFLLRFVRRRSHALASCAFRRSAFAPSFSASRRSERRCKTVLHREPSPSEITPRLVTGCWCMRRWPGARSGVWTLSARGERVRTSGVVGDGGGKCLLFSMAPESPQRRREFSRRSRRSSCAAPGSDSGWRDESSSFRFLRGRDLPRLSGLASAARVLCAGRSPPFQASLKSAAVAANEEDSLASASLPFAASGRPSAEWRKGAARAFRQGRCCVSLRREASAFCAGARPSLLRRVFENRPKEEEQRANPGVEAEEWILRLSERCCLRKAEFWSAVYGGGNRSSNGVPSGRRVQIFGLDETPEVRRGHAARQNAALRRGA